MLGRGNHERLLGVDPLRALTHHVVSSVLDVLAAVGTADLLNRFVVKVLAEGRRRVLLKLSRLFADPRLRKEVLEGRGFAFHRSLAHVLRLLPLACVDFANPKFLLALPRLQVE